MRKRVLLPVILGLLCFPLTGLHTEKARAAVSPLAGETAGTADNAAVKDEGIQIARGGGRGGGGRGGGRGGGANRGGGGHKNVNRGGNRNNNANRNTNRNRNTNTNRNRNTNTNRNVNRSVNRNVNVNVRHRGYGWRGARWGAVAFGVTMGTAIVVAANTPPYPPDPSLCWTWSNSALTRGYWYYCSGP